jgi:hypothetical protein
MSIWGTGIVTFYGAGKLPRFLTFAGQAWAECLMHDIRWSVGCGTWTFATRRIHEGARVGLSKFVITESRQVAYALAAVCKIYLFLSKCHVATTISCALVNIFWLGT